MKNPLFRFAIFSLVLLLCLIFSCKQQGEKIDVEKKAMENLQLDQIPTVVMDSLKARFPEAEIHKWTREKEGDIVIYDIEFKQVGRKFEADIVEDGTIHNWEKAIGADDLPEAVMKSVEEKYPKATLREIMEITEVKGKEEKLEGYEVVLETVDKREVEVMVAPDGKVIEEESREKKQEKE